MFCFPLLLEKKINKVGNSLQKISEISVAKFSQKDPFFFRVPESQDSLFIWQTKSADH